MWRCGSKCCEVKWTGRNEQDKATKSIFSSIGLQHVVEELSSAYSFKREDFLSKLISAPDEFRVQALVYSMGVWDDEILKAFNSWRLAIVHERGMFEIRNQFKGRRVEEIVTALHSLLLYCGYGSLRDTLVRNRKFEEKSWYNYCLQAVDTKSLEAVNNKNKKLVTRVRNKEASMLPWICV